MKLVHTIAILLAAAFFLALVLALSGVANLGFWFYFFAILALVAPAVVLLGPGMGESVIGSAGMPYVKGAVTIWYFVVVFTIVGSVTSNWGPATTDALGSRGSYLDIETARQVNPPGSVSSNALYSYCFKLDEQIGLNYSNALRESQVNLNPDENGKFPTLETATAQNQRQLEALKNGPCKEYFNRGLSGNTISLGEVQVPNSWSAFYNRYYYWLLLGGVLLIAYFAFFKKSGSGNPHHAGVIMNVGIWLVVLLFSCLIVQYVSWVVTHEEATHQQRLHN